MDSNQCRAAFILQISRSHLREIGIRLGIGQVEEENGEQKRGGYRTGGRILGLSEFHARRAGVENKHTVREWLGAAKRTRVRVR